MVSIAKLQLITSLCNSF